MLLTALYFDVLIEKNMLFLKLHFITFRHPVSCYCFLFSKNDTTNSNIDVTLFLEMI